MSPRQVTALMIRQMTQGMLWVSSRPVPMRKNSSRYGSTPTPMLSSIYTSAFWVKWLRQNANTKLHTSVTLHKIGITRSML